MKGSRFFILLTLLAGLLAGGCGTEKGPPAVSGHPVRFPLATDPQTLDPARATDNVSITLNHLIGDSLVHFDQDLNIVPRVAQSWEWSDDKLTLTFHLRSHVLWHDGKPVTAQDVVHTWQQVTDPGRGAPDVALFFNLVDSVTATDSRTAVVRYRRPFAPALVAWALPLLPRHHPGMDPPLGCGPWVFEKWEKGARLIVRANPDYYDGPPKIPRLEFEILRDFSTRLAALQAGRIDMAPLAPDQWELVKKDPAFLKRFTLLEFPMLYYFYIAWRMDGSNPFFTDAEVRQALTLAIDRAGYLEKIGKGFGVPAVTSIHPRQWAFDSSLSPWPFDPEAARARLERAGWVDRNGDGFREKNGTPFRFKLSYPTTTKEWERIAVFVQSGLKEVGVEVVLEPLEWAVFRERTRAGRFEAMMSGRQLDSDPDPYDLWHSSQARGGVNYAGLADPELDHWLEQARETYDRQERIRLYHLVQRRLHELQPVTFFSYSNSKWAVDQRLKGIQPTPLGLFHFWPGSTAWEWSLPSGS